MTKSKSKMYLVSVFASREVIVEATDVLQASYICRDLVDKIWQIDGSKVSATMLSDTEIKEHLKAGAVMKEDW